MKDRKQGFTLLEVMISAMVIMIGLLGIAALIPAGRSQIASALQKDMVANYGRAGLRTIMTSGILKDSPAERINWGADDIANGTVPPSASPRDGISIFDVNCSDDLQVMEIAGAHYPTYRTDLSKTNYEWVATIFRMPGTEYYEVSVAVSHKRPEAGHCAGGTLNGRYGDGSIMLSRAMNIHPGEWVYVYNGTLAHWYKVVDVTFNDTVKIISVSGPAWTSANTSVTVSTPGNVQGVYTEVMSSNTR